MIAQEVESSTNPITLLILFWSFYVDEVEERGTNITKMIEWKRSLVCEVILLNYFKIIFLSLQRNSRRLFDNQFILYINHQSIHTLS